MPFGRLVKESLETGLNTLFDIKDLVLALYEAKQALTNVLDTNRMQWFLEQTMSLTFEFNKSVPNQGKRIERIKLLSDLAEIENKIQQTRDLIKLEFANNLLLAAQYRINDANPIDYIYKSLNCQMVALKRDSEESNAIVKFIENSGCESTVMQMFKVYREADVESLVASDIENHKLLWMPTSLTNVLYTLAKGTAVPCPQSERKDNPSRYRKGLDKPDDDSFSIFYEMFADLKSECPTFSTEKKYAFLCQVAVGKPKDVPEIPKQRPEGVFDSIKITGKDSFSNDDHVIISPEGASIPLGKRNTTNPTASFPSNRYLIYNDTNQMAIRYLVRFN